MPLKRLISSILTLASLAALPDAANAQAVSAIPTATRPVVRITQKVDNHVTTSLAGTHPAVVEHAAVGARLAASKALPHMLLVLNPSDDQVFAMQTLLTQQQDKTSPNYISG